MNSLPATPEIEETLKTKGFLMDIDGDTWPDLRLIIAFLKIPFRMNMHTSCSRNGNVADYRSHWWYSVIHSIDKILPLWRHLGSEALSK